MTPATNYTDVLLTRFAGNTSPDICEMDTEFINPFFSKKLLMNLEPYLKKSSKISEKDFFPGSLLNFRYDGSHIRKGDVYGLPKDLAAAALIYNKDLFDQEKLPYPNDKWTYQDYVEAAKKLTKMDSSGRRVRLGVERPLDPLMIALNEGGHIWSDDYRKCMLDSKEGIAAFQSVYDLQITYRAALPTTQIDAAMTEAFGFISGKAGMSMIYRYELPDLLKGIRSRFKWSVAPLPLVNGRRLQVFYGPSGWCISSGTKHPKEAFEFLEFLAGKRAQIENAKLGWDVPADERVAESDDFLKDLNRPDSEAINRVFLDAMKDMYWGFVNPYIPARRLVAIMQDGSTRVQGRGPGERWISRYRTW